MAAVLFTSGQILKQQTGVIGIAYVRSNKYSDKAVNLAALKRGTGGRSSFNGVVATVFGATGFLGRYVVNKLGKTGTQMIIPYRGDFYDAARLKVAGDLGQVLFLPYDVRDYESVLKAMKYSNVVINLIGRDWETKNFKMDDVHVKAARTIAKAAKESGVQKLIHMSALNCSPKPQSFFVSGGSKFMMSKFRGEEAVREEFPSAVIFRPSDIYGQEDRFLRYYIHGWRRTGHWIGLWKKGEETIKQPVAVSDVALGIVNAIKDSDADGKIFQAIGPKRYKLSELVDWFYKLMRRTGDEWDYWRYDLRYDPFFKIRVAATNLVCPSWPVGYLTWERIERENFTDIVQSDLPTLEDLGVTLTHMEDQVPWELRPFVWDLYHGFCADAPLPAPDPPKIAT